MYYDSAFLIAKFISDIPFNVVMNFLFATMVFWTTNLSTSAVDYICFCLIVIVLAQSANFLAQLMATILPDDQTANLVFTVIMPVSLLFTGFLITEDNIPQGWKWMHWADFATYQLFFMTSLTMKDVVFSCPNGEGEVPVFVGVNSSNCSSSVTDYSNQNCWQVICPITNGNQILDFYNVNADLQWAYFAGALGFMLVFAALLFIAFHKVRHLKR
jgi:ABC-type multidrug transport system permease subunit